MTTIVDGVMLVGAVGSLATATVPAGSRVAVWGWTDGDDLELLLDGVSVPVARDVERPDVPPPGRGFATLLPAPLLTSGSHRVEASAGGASGAVEFTVAPLVPGGAYLGRIDDVWIGDSTFIRAGDARFDLPLGGPLLVEGWTTPAPGATPWFLLRVGAYDIIGDVTADRPDVTAVHAAVPARCGFATTIPADVLTLAAQDVLVAIPRAADDWIVTDRIVIRGVVYASLPVFVRTEPSSGPRAAVHTVYRSDAEVLFTADGIPVGGYRSAVEPGVFRVEPRYAAHDGLAALEIVTASLERSVSPVT